MQHVRRILEDDSTLFRNGTAYAGPGEENGNETLANDNVPIAEQEKDGRIRVIDDHILDVLRDTDLLNINSKRFRIPRY